MSVNIYLQRSNIETILVSAKHEIKSSALIIARIIMNCM